MENEVMLTTFDNPYDYFEQFTLWLLFDKEKGYNTCEYLDRILTKNVGETDDLSQKEIDIAIEEAIDEIIEYNPLSIYKKVWRNKPTTSTMEI